MLLDQLLWHASSPDYTVRFGWNRDDFVLWDNRSTRHCAVDDYGDGARAYRKVIDVDGAASPDLTTSGAPAADLPLIPGTACRHPASPLVAPSQEPS